MSTLPPHPPSMSPPSAPPPPAPAKSGRKGCIIAVVVTLVLILLLVGGCIVYVSRNAGGLMAMGLEAAKPQMLAAIDPGVSTELRESFVSEYDAQIAYLRQLTEEKRKDEMLKALTAVQFVQQAAADKSLTTEEIEQFIQMARDSRGVTAP